MKRIAVLLLALLLLCGCASDPAAPETPRRDGNRSRGDLRSQAVRGRRPGRGVRPAQSAGGFRRPPWQPHARASEQDSGTDWAKLKLVSLSEADGVYTTDLGAVSVALTLSLTDEGLYRVETAELLP